MIERIQTVYLFLIVVLMTTYCFLPIWEKTDAKTNEKVTLTALSLDYTKPSENKKTTNSTIYLVILAGLAGLNALYSIFLYKNRLLQIKFVLTNTLMLCSVLAMSVFANMQGEKLFINQTTGGTYQIAFYLIPVAIILNFLARKAIKSDEDLVRSADRLR